MTAGFYLAGNLSRVGVILTTSIWSALGYHFLQYDVTVRIKWPYKL